MSRRLLSGKAQIIALHGFLGQPSDWKDLLLSHFPEIAIEVPQLFNQLQPFEQWAKQFNDHYSGVNNILMGYSMGGRLALHALIDDPTKYSAAIIVSCHYGLNDPTQIQQRLTVDQQRAKDFLYRPWVELMSQWSSLPVFSADPFHFIRRENDYSRESLAESLDVWSLARQEFLKEKLESLNVPILWVAGENDLNYVTLATSLSLTHPQSKIWIAKDAGHRVPWQKQKDFLNGIQNFIEQ